VPPQPAQSVAHIDARSLAVPTLELAARIKMSGCSGGDFVAVVPAEDGHVGTVVVESEGNKTVLHAAYAGCSGSRPVITSPQALNRQFGGALAARPTPPVAFELYYRTGSVTLAPDALAVFDKAFAEIGRRSAVDVVVAGFTDTVGTPRGNDLLSLARAHKVTMLLIESGLKRDSIMTVGRGERDPQIPTAPQVAEDKNRRVEITVR
jgi:adhesin transport system outer membrane protein